LRAWSNSIVNGTGDPIYTYYEVMANWMLNTGKTSKDWEDLPAQDVRLMEVLYLSNLKRQHNMMKKAISEGMYNGKKPKSTS